MLVGRVQANIELLATAQGSDSEFHKAAKLPMGVKDTLAERLRRRPAKPMGSPRVGSNPTGVVWQFCGK